MSAFAFTPLAYFITWTVYATHLQGDDRGWRKRGKGNCEPQPKLVAWHEERLKHETFLFEEQQRALVKEEIVRVCHFKEWKLWAVNVRTNHVHVVVTTATHSDQFVRDSLKANATRYLREHFPVFHDRKVWTKGGDIEWIDTEENLQEVIDYVLNRQD
ncbi:MAG: transposase [Zavarzinella sp.]